MPRLDESTRYAAAAVRLENREPVHIPSPAVPRGDEGAHDLSVALGEQQGISRVLNELGHDRLVICRHGGSAPSPLPHVENGANVRMPCRTDGQGSDL